MKNMKPTFEKTVDVLVKAYLNDTLEHQVCHKCAVGNLVAHAAGKDPEEMRGHWYRLIVQKCQYDMGFLYTRAEAIAQIESTGYSADELLAIEKAFESVIGIKDYEVYTEEEKETAMFNGLMAVVDVLAEIHGIDLERKESAKLLFQKA